MERKKSAAKGDAKLDWTWEAKGTLYVGDCGTTPSAKIASFDMDDTLIRVKSGKKFPTNSDDWVFWAEQVPKKLAQFDK
jgi:hypothetical protein